MMPGTRTLITALPAPVLVIGADGIVQCANPAAHDLFGAQIEGAQVRAYLRQPAIIALLDRALAEGLDAQGVYHSSLGQQETRWHVEARRTEDNRVVLSFTDISAIESAETQRRDFVANVSHELRSPLTVLSGFVETLQGPAGEDPETRTQFLGIMAEQAARMQGLVADLLSLSRVEAVEKIRPRTPVALSMVVAATLAALRPQIENAKLRLDLDMPSDLPQIAGDHDQLVQVFHNLVENAIRYGAAGGRIEITARQVPGLPGFEGPVQIVTVRDFGEGIDPIQIPRLTERFYRVDKARARDSGGTGLGLAIVKHILSRHRGRLVIRSTPGEGASFEAQLPCAYVNGKGPSA
jgi:two-component system phosphate regulon sensor histidine kinase PhoR